MPKGKGYAGFSAKDDSAPKMGSAQPGIPAVSNRPGFGKSKKKKKVGKN